MSSYFFRIVLKDCVISEKVFCLKMTKKYNGKRKKCAKDIKNTRIMLSNIYEKRYNGNRLTVQ